MTQPKSWILPPVLPSAVEAELSDYPPLQRTILARRGVTSRAEARTFLDRRHEGLTDPWLLLGMQQAVARIQQARASGERVVVYGDYDADGVTATVLLYEALLESGCSVDWYIPDRFEEGYGLNAAALRSLREQGTRLVVSVDCGIRSIGEAAEAHAAGLDLIITDHHLPGANLPQALAALNPSRPGDPYPFKDLAGVGLAYKLAQALHLQAGGPDPERFLDLVAIGTVADLAPLQGENRALVSAGLERLNTTRRPGLLALIDIAGFPLGGLNAASIGFGLGPRLNAAGRLANASEAVELLLSKSAAQARSSAERLDHLNRERQRITRRVVEQAQELLAAAPVQGHVLLAAAPDFHEGVVGLAASRLAETYFRPALLMVLEAGILKGSARSVPGFHITDALDACSELLLRFGGHAQAAGFALAEDDLVPFGERMERIAERAFAELDLKPLLELDAVVELAALDDDLMAFQDSLEPCGQGNPTPMFASRGVQVLTKRTVGAEGRHLKLTLRQGEAVFEAIAFRQGGLAASLPDLVDVAYRFERNEFRGVVTPQLNVEDIRPAGA